MRVIMCLASEYGFECLKNIDDKVDIVGIITTHQFFSVKHGKECRQMTNTIFESLHLYANDKNILLFEMERMNTSDTEHFIQKCNAELMIVSGWYHLIKENILNLFPKGVIGLHSSMLPRYRGGAPLVWQMINGEEKAGISLFYLDTGIDSGDIIAQKEIFILEEDTIKTLYKKIGDIGIQLLVDNLPLIEVGNAPRMKQQGLSDADIWPQRMPKDGEIDWNKSAKQVKDFIRAQTKPYPGAYTYIGNKKVTIWDCDIEEI